MEGGRGAYVKLCKAYVKLGAYVKLCKAYVTQYIVFIGIRKLRM